MSRVTRDVMPEYLFVLYCGVFSILLGILLKDIYLYNRPYWESNKPIMALSSQYIHHSGSVVKVANGWNAGPLCMIVSSRGKIAHR